MKNYKNYIFDPTKLDNEDIEALTEVATTPACPFTELHCEECALYNHDRCSTEAANILKTHEDYLIDSILLGEANEHS